MKIKNFEKVQALMNTYKRLKQAISALNGSDELELTICSINGTHYRELIGKKENHITPYASLCNDLKEALLFVMIRDAEKLKSEIESL